MIKRRRMQVSTDKGKTWKYRWISPLQNDPNLSELKAGELVKVNGNEHIVIVANGKLACPPLGLSLLADVGKENEMAIQLMINEFNAAKSVPQVDDWDHGWNTALQYAINKLEYEVKKQDAPSDTNRADG